MRHPKVALTILALALVGCGGGGDGGPTTPGDYPGSGGSGGGGGTGPTTTTNQITVADNSFSPPSSTVALGATVTWTWAQGNYSEHTVTFSDGGSGSLFTGTFQRQFTAAGTYSYSCTNHVGMTGAITVQ